MFDYLIVGAGLYGSVFAHEMSKIGKKCLVLERRPHVSGNIYTKSIKGINTHVYGAHIFHTDKKHIWEYINQFAQFNNFINCPLANYKGVIYNLPFNMNTFYKMWGVKTPSKAMDIIRKQQIEITGAPKNLEEQAISMVGRDIYEILIKEYTEKQWGRECVDLPPFIIKRLPVRFTYNNNYFNDRYQGIPIGGYTNIINKLLESSEVRLNIDYLADRENWDRQAKKVVFTGSIDAYYDYKYGALKYRSIRFDTEVLEIKNYQGNAVVNYTDSETPFTRIIEHKHFEFGNQPYTVISKEYSEEWTMGKEPYYPINDAQNNGLYLKYASLVKNEGKTVFGGRLGEYRYYDMDEVIEAALKRVNEEDR